MTGREIIMALIDTREMDPEIVRLMGHKKHSTDELKDMIDKVLKEEPKKKKIVWSFGCIKVHD